MAYCERSDLPTDQCALPCCRGLVKSTTRVETGGIGHPFRARYDGRCGQPGCHSEISEGDLIRYVEDRIACGSCS